MDKNKYEFLKMETVIKIKLLINEKNNFEFIFMELERDVITFLK